MKIFDYEIIKDKVPLQLYENEELSQGIIEIFKSKFILEEGTHSPEKNNEGYSTCGLGNHFVTDLKNINPLINYISDIIMKNFYNYAHIPRDKKIFYTRMWINKIHKNCSGKIHTHEGHNDGTAIFYYKVPENGSKLIISKYKKDIDQIEQTNENNVFEYIDVKTGDLIIHKRDVPHGVSEHLNTEPRICFVLDFMIQKKFTYN
jgi:hypothetical protein